VADAHPCAINGKDTTGVHWLTTAAQGGTCAVPWFFIAPLTSAGVWVAVDLSVAEGTHALGAFAFAAPGVTSQTLSGCFDVRKTANNWVVRYGWGGKDSNLRMAGSKSDQHNQQVTDPIHPAGPLDSLRFPIAATKAATSVRGSGRRAWPGSRRQELSPIRSTEAPRRTLSRHTNSAAGGSAYRPRRFDRVSESRTSSHQSRIDDDVGKVSLAPRNPTSCGMHQALSAPRVGKVGTRTRDPRRDRPVPMSASMTEEERAPHESGIYPILVGLRTYPLLPRH